MPNLDTRRPLRLTPVLAALGCGMCSLGANADVVQDIQGNPDIAPFFQVFAHSSIHDHVTRTDPGFEFNDGTLKTSNSGIGGQSMNTSFELNGAQVTAYASAVPGGFLTSRNAASISITNANAEDGYYMLAGYGSMTTARFFSPEALADRATFRWRVSGLESTVPAGKCDPDTQTFNICSTARIDFAATANANPNYYDLLYPSTPGPSPTMTEFGPGDYTYSIAGMPLDQVITFGYWTSAFVQINPGQLNQGGDYNFYANYANTFELEGIDLYDAENNLLTDWTLADPETGQTFFTPEGRVPENVPEPVTLALMGIGLLGLAASRRRRQA